MLRFVSVFLPACVHHVSLMGACASLWVRMLCCVQLWFVGQNTDQFASTRSVPIRVVVAWHVCCSPHSLLEASVVTDSSVLSCTVMVVVVELGNLAHFNPK